MLRGIKIINLQKTNSNPVMKKPSTSEDLKWNKEETLPPKPIENLEKLDPKEIQQTQVQKTMKTIKSCPICESKDFLTIALGESVKLLIPPFGSFVKGHCIITTMDHKNTINECDAQELKEVVLFKESVKKMFQSLKQDVLFIETVTSYHRKNELHAFIECIPIPSDIFKQMPGYFKKALMGTGSEWSNNNKIIDTREKGLLRSIPKGFAYFHVEFGVNGGYCHLIENDLKFKYFFGREVIGDILELPKNLLKERQEDEMTEKKNVYDFCQKFQDYDWTIALEGGEYQLENN